MRKTKFRLPILLLLVLVVCFSSGALAANGDITSPAGQPNQYVVSADIANGSVSTDTLYIGTVANYLGAAAKGSTTVFVNGEAIHPHDIIIMNNKVGIVLAVGTRNPWGYPSGSILDAGRVNGAADSKNLKGNVTFGRDTVWSVEFLMNGWDSWSPNNSGVVKFEVVNYDFEGKKEVASGGLPAVKVSRVFEEVGDLTFDVITYYSIGPDNEYAYIFDTVKSNNDVESPSLSNRFSITNKGDDGGAMADLALLTGINTYGKTDRNVFATTLIIPGTNTGYVNGNSVGDRPWSRNGGSVGYKELRANYPYAPQEFRVYDEYLFIDDQADTRAVVDFLNDYYAKETMAVSGTAYNADGKKTISQPVVIVKKDDAVYGWFIGAADGTFAFDLPKGDYTVYVESNGFDKGEPIAVSEGTSTGLSLQAGEALVEVTFDVQDEAGNPLWARVEIDGLYPVVRFTGDSVFYAEDENSKGEVSAMVPPGEFTAKVFGEGYYFYSLPVIDTYNTKEKAAYDVAVDMEFAAPEGWISTDPHHHSNKNDAFALPEDVIRSLLASGLDVAFTSDHDFTTNNFESYTYAQKYGMSGYLPSEEISASWAHFNVVPQTSESYRFFLDENQQNHIMDQFADFKVFVRQTHDAGATITANHPYYSYGLFYTNENSRVPGGYENSFDNVEINACSTDKEHIDTVNKAAELWSAYLGGGKVSGEPVTKAHYLLGASDTHDVLYPGIDNSKPGVYNSGKARTFVYLGDITGMSSEEVGLATGRAIANGSSYASLGPILTPKEEMFGEKIVVAQNDSQTFNTSIEVESLNGVATILLLSNLGDTTYTYNGEIVKNVLKINNYNGENTLTYGINEEIAAGEDAWFAIMVIDAGTAKMFAISNPFWIDVANSDTANHWAKDSIEKLMGMGAIQGYEDGSFKPNNNITRAEFASILVKAFNLSPEQGTVFADTANHWAKDSIATAAAHGILTGYGTDKFGPNDPITREQMAVMIVKAAELTTAEAGKTFADGKTVSSWAAESVNTVVGENIMSGYEDNTFKPQNKATRAEAVTVIVKALGL